MSKVVIQGLGFVGAAMSTVIAGAKNLKGELLHKVVGVELDNENGRSRVNSINKGLFPFPIDDLLMKQSLGGTIH